jgi:hypothetical protein
MLDSEIIHHDNNTAFRSPRRVPHECQNKKCFLPGLVDAKLKSLALRYIEINAIVG